MNELDKYLNEIDLSETECVTDDMLIFDGIDFSEIELD